MGTEETWCGWVDSATGPGDVFQCQEPCPCWWGVQWRVWSEGWSSLRLCSHPAVFHHCAWSLVTWVLLWSPMGGQAGGGGFLLLPGRHALRSQRLWTFNHNTCENRLEEVQGADTSSLFPPPFFQDTWPCVQLLCAEGNAPCQWDLAINKAQPPASAAKMTEQWSDISAMLNHTTLPTSGPLSYLLGIEDLDLLLKERLRWYGHVKRSNGAVKTRQPLTYRLLERVSLGGPRWLGCSWQRGIAENGSSQLSTFMKETPGDLVWGVLCVQQTSYLEGGPLLWILPLYLHVNKKIWWWWWWWWTQRSKFFSLTRIPRNAVSRLPALFHKIEVNL